MNNTEASKFLFVINSASGSNDTNWEETINRYFSGKGLTTEFFMLGKTPDDEALKKKIGSFNPDKIIAVGGDGTVGMVAKIITGSKRALGILPAGSANGMARELKIPETPEEALAIIENGRIAPCDAIIINEKEICLHLSDIGLNAQLIKHFDEGKLRGKLGYARVMLKTLWRSQKISVSIQLKEKKVNANAFMVVLANASKYGTGAVINPDGKLNDGLFEVIIVHKLSIIETLKMLVRPALLDPKKIEIFHAASVHISTGKNIHFQVDGEYIGKVNKLQAKILPAYVNFIMP